jgi:hypothetical protein
MQTSPQQIQRAVIAAISDGRHLSTWAQRAVVRAAQRGEVDTSRLSEAWQAWADDPTSDPPPADDPELWHDLERKATGGDEAAAAGLLVLVYARQQPATEVHRIDNA